MEELLNSVNAEQGANVEPQIEQGETAQVEQGENVEVAEPQKPVQSPEENAKYAAIRREAEQKTQKAIDAEYSRLYGAEYGIHTKADYDAAIAKQEAEAKREQFKEENGIDPEALKPVFQQWKESDPDFQELKAIRAEKNTNTALADLNNELKDAGLDLQIKDTSSEELLKLPNIDKILDLVQNKKHSLADAFFLANKKDIINRQAQTAQQETIKKIAANGASSPGSLSNNNTEETFFTKEQVDKMSKADVVKNYDQIIKSTKKW
jgi:hypothetical protein